MERIFDDVKITSSFEIPETRENLVSGETIGQHFGKIAKVINDLENGEFSSKTTIDTELSDTSTNPVQNKVVKQAIDNKADKSLYGDTTINVGRRADTSVGLYSTAEGWNTTASGNNSHAEGGGTTASGDFSHAGGYCTEALNRAEFAHGKYNQSNANTLFSIGDGTAGNARHNAFEITTTGGKLHDKDIATTDLIPTSLPANGGNADTVDGKHAGDFATSINPTIIGSIKIMGYSTNTVQSIFSDGDIIRIRNLDSETSQTNNYADIIITTSGVFTEKAVNGVWQGRKELLTSTCVTGTSTIVDSNNFVSANFGFTPSAVLYAVYDSKTGIDDNYRLAHNFNSGGFITETRTALPIGGGIETFSYIAFR